MEEFEEWLSVDRDVTKLIMQHDRAGARRLLLDSAETAASRNQFEVASHFANELGSLSAADNLDDEALSAYLWAEKLNPSDGTLKISMANFLLLFQAKPAEAIQKIDEAIPLVENNPEKRYALGDSFATK